MCYFMAEKNLRQNICFAFCFQKCCFFFCLKIIVVLAKLKKNEKFFLSFVELFLLGEVTKDSNSICKKFSTRQTSFRPQFLRSENIKKFFRPLRIYCRNKSFREPVGTVDSKQSNARFLQTARFTKFQKSILGFQKKNFFILRGTYFFL